MRNVILLSLSQALAMSVSPVMVLVGGILGAQIAPTPALATLPVSMMVVGLAFSTIPASFLMRRIGRKRGFMTGVSIAAIACLLAAYAVNQQSFTLFCLAAFLIGSNTAFIAQYRFAASESVPKERAGRAVSWVLVGGIFAGILGPEIAKRTVDLLPGEPFSGTFIVIALVLGVVFLLLMFLKDISTRLDKSSGEERPLRSILRQPSFRVAVLAGVLSYGVMSFIMTATPLQMHTMHGFSVADTAWVIQSHIIAMYLPSLFSGILVERLGIYTMISIGVACMFVTVGIGLVSRELLHYWWALVLLGVGWNFLFVSGTVLLTRSYFPSERFKAQAVNDFSVFGIQAITSLAAGTVLFTTNWGVLNLLNIPALLLMLVALGWLYWQSRAAVRDHKSVILLE